MVGNVSGGARPGATYQANIVTGTSPGGAGWKMVDPELAVMGGWKLLTADSPAIDEIDGAFPFVMDDVQGQARMKADIGADELSTAPALRRPLTTANDARTRPSVDTLRLQVGASMPRKPRSTSIAPPLSPAWLALAM